MKLLIQVFVIFESTTPIDNDDDTTDYEVIEHIKEIRSRRYEINNISDLERTLNNASADIELQIANAKLKESGLTLKGIKKITINYDRYNPTRGGSYIELPKYIGVKGACINIQNEDDKCFKYSVQCVFFIKCTKQHTQNV